MTKDVCVHVVQEDLLGVIDKFHNVFHVSEKNVTLDTSIEGKSSVSKKSCNSEALHYESGVSNGESQSKSSEKFKVKILCSIGT